METKLLGPSGSVDSGAPATQAPPPEELEQEAAAERETADLIAYVFDQEHEERIDAQTLETALTSLLALYPDAPVGAHGPDGMMVAMPDSVALQRNPVLEARSGLDLAVHDEVVLRGWEQVLAIGAARYPVRPLSRPHITCMVYGLDLRETHGVILIVSVIGPTGTAEGADGEVARPMIPEVTPRFATICKDARGMIIKIDEATTKILGWSAEEMKGRRASEFMHPDDQSLAVDNWMEMMAATGPGRRVRLRHRRKAGSWVWFEVTNHNLLGDPDYRCVVSEIVDISEEMAAHELLDNLAEAIPVGLLQFDAARQVVYTNDRLHQILGVARMDVVDAQLASVTDADRPVLEGALEDVLVGGLQADIEIELRVPPGGDSRFCAVSFRPLDQDEAITGATACVTDTTDSAHMREELKRRATLDDLTGCYNRAAIMRALEIDIASPQREADRAVVFIDLDCFKAVNDLHGHAAGDELLSIVARRLQHVLRSGDMVGRIGGDEFLAVCPDIGGPEQAMRLGYTEAPSWTMPDS